MVCNYTSRHCDLQGVVRLSQKCSRSARSLRRQCCRSWRCRENLTLEVVGHDGGAGHVLGPQVLDGGAAVHAAAVAWWRVARGDVVGGAGDCCAVPHLHHHLPSRRRVDPAAEQPSHVSLQNISSQNILHMRRYWPALHRCPCHRDVPRNSQDGAGYSPAACRMLARAAA